MQVLNYEGREDAHVCLNCDAEFIVDVVNSDGDETVVEFCPCCGAALDEIDVNDDIDVDDEDGYGLND